MNKNMLRKPKKIEEMSELELNKVLTSSKLPYETRLKVLDLIAKERKANAKFSKAFFSDKNRFWKLAKHQLYREGHSGVTLDRTFEGESVLVLNDVPREVILDKMVEIKKKYDIHLEEQENIKKGKKRGTTIE